MGAEIGEALRVFVVDDHPAVREGLILLLAQRGICVCGDAEDAPQTLTRVEATRPDVVLVDLSLQGSSGVSLIEELHGMGLLVLVYSMHEDVVHIKRAFAAGAGGYVTKRDGANTLVQAIHEVLSGNRYLSERARNALIEENPTADDPDSRLHILSDRELLVLQRTGEGDTGEEIARQLHISPRTVESYYTRIIKKLGLSGMKELRRYAIQRGHEGGNGDDRATSLI